MSKLPQCACDVYGPDENTMAGQLDALHRAMHDLGRTLMTDRTFHVALLLTWMVTAGAAVIAEISW